MTSTSTNAILRAAARNLTWALFAAAGYGRTRAFIDIEKFERELLSAARQWKATHANLKDKGERNERTKP